MGLAGRGAWRAPDGSGRKQGATRPRLSGAMYKISAEPSYLRAELFERETVEETRAFLNAVVRNNANHRRSRVLILVRTSKSVFQVVAHGLLECFQQLSATTPGQIALVGDTRDLRLSHEYIEVVARQHGLNVRSFRDEAAALAWLNDRRHPDDRRLQPERRRQERRASLESRQSARG